MYTFPGAAAADPAQLLQEFVYTIERRTSLMPFIEDLEWPSAMWQDEDIQSALDAAGYEGPPTPERLKTCFMDYVDAGYWGDLTMDEAQEDVERGVITPDQMIRALRGRRRS